MRQTLMFIFAFITFLSFGQEVNQVDAQGRKQGKWEKLHPGTRVYQYKGEFKNDKPVGKFTYYYESSKVKAIIKHNEIRTGRSVAFFYHENGNVMSYGIYTNGKKDSVWTNFTPSGRLSNTETYKDDKLDGVKKIYFTPSDPSDKSQVVSTKMTYKNGMLEGEYVEYFLNGKTKLKGQYVDNKQDGAWEEFHPNGKRASLYRYYKGMKHGYAIAYDANGKRIGELMYFQGSRVTGKDLEELLKKMEEQGINPYTMKPKE